MACAPEDFARGGTPHGGGGRIAERDDVFWLKWEEAEAVSRALDAGHAAGDHRRAIAERRESWRRERGATPPVVLPIKGGVRLLGFDVSRFMPARSGRAAGGLIQGIGASPGRVTGTARVICGPEEFAQMKPGDILVARITTPAWTPLFALAAGVVTDVGGPLSHSSHSGTGVRRPRGAGDGRGDTAHTQRAARHGRRRQRCRESGRTCNELNFPQRKGIPARHPIWALAAAGERGDPFAQSEHKQGPGLSARALTPWRR